MGTLSLSSRAAMRWDSRRGRSGPRRWTPRCPWRELDDGGDGSDHKPVVVPLDTSAVIRACDEHGFLEGEACPGCGDEGRHVLDEDRRTRLSKFISGALRHFPDDAGLTLDDQGWAEYEALVEAVTGTYPWADPEHVAAVVATDPNGRFDRRGDRVRATYGHSVDVDLESTDAAVPDRLYHGTAPRNLDSIAEDGLKPMGRQQVHLSATPADARAVGERHAETPVLLTIGARAMEEDGFEIDRRGTRTYTVDQVPPEYVERFDETAVTD